MRPKENKKEKEKKQTPKKEQKTENIDASGLVMGRIASIVAPKLLAGYNINIYNAENAVITGKENNIVKDYFTKINFREKGNPTKSPKYSRMPHGILKSAVRRMLPHNKPRGLEAEKRLKVFVGNYDNLSLIKYNDAKLKMSLNYITLGNLSKKLGAKW